MTTVEMIEVMKAWVGGATVQYKGSLQEWIDFNGSSEPSWNWQLITWRIKPAERKPREFLIYPRELMAMGIVLPITDGYKKAIENGMVHVREVLPE